MVKNESETTWNPRAWHCFADAAFPGKFAFPIPICEHSVRRDWQARDTKHFVHCVVITSSKSHGRRKDFFQGGHLAIIPKFFQRGPKVVKFVFSH